MLVSCFNSRHKSSVVMTTLSNVIGSSDDNVELRVVDQWDTSLWVASVQGKTFSTRYVLCYLTRDILMGQCLAPSLIGHPTIVLNKS